MSSQVAAELQWRSRWCSRLHSHSGRPFTTVNGIMIAIQWSPFIIVIVHYDRKSLQSQWWLPSQNAIANCVVMSSRLYLGWLFAMVNAFSSFKRTCLRDIAFTIMNELVACHYAWQSQSRSRSRQSRMPSRNTITMLWLVVTIAIVCTTISNAGTEGKYTGARDGIWFGHSPCQRQPRSPSQLHSCHIYVIDDYFVLCDRWFEITTLLVLWSAKRYWFLCGLFEKE